MNDSELLKSVMTAGEVAREFGVTDSAVRKAIAEKRVKARKSGGTWLITRHAAEKLWYAGANPGAAKEKE